VDADDKINCREEIKKSICFKEKMRIKEIKSSAKK